MNELKKLLSNKEILSDLIKDHLEEFKGMERDEIMNCFVGEVQVDKKPVYMPFYEGEEDLKYGIYFKLISPKLNYYHEIRCVVEVREKYDKIEPSEMPACAGLSLLMMVQGKQENQGKELAQRCYGFYVYTNASEHLKGKQNQYNIHIKASQRDLLNNNRCTGIEIFL